MAIMVSLELGDLYIGSCTEERNKDPANRHDARSSCGKSIFEQTGYRQYFIRTSMRKGAYVVIPVITL